MTQSRITRPAISSHHVLCAAALMVSTTTAAASPPPEVEAQLREIGPRIEIARTSQIYKALLPTDLYAGAKVERDLAYGTDEKQKLDVFTATQSTARRKPVLVFVHGGGFVGGDKYNGTSPLYDNVMGWAAKHGLVGVNLNYRLAPANSWPSGADDIAFAVEWIRQNISRFGGNPEQIYLWGHSVGATHIADYIAQQNVGSKRVPGVQGAILSSGQIYDMTGPNVSKPYHGTDDTKYAAMASLKGLAKSKITLMITDAELDPPAFRDQTAILKQALNKSGRNPVSFEASGHSHISEIYAIGTSDTSLSDAVLRFVKR